MKFKRAKNTDVQLDTAVVGDVSSPPKISRKKLAIGGIAIIVLLGAALGIYVWRISSNVTNEVSDDELVQIDPSVAAAASIDILSDEQLASAASKDVDARTNITDARVKAAALVQLNDVKGAVVVYEQIENARTGFYEDTVNYAFAVLATGDYKKSVSLLEQAKIELQESDAKDAVKKTYAEYIDNKIRAIQKEEAEL